MTKKQTVTLNLTKEEAECISMVFSGFKNSYWLTRADVKPCTPFLKKLENKINSAVTVKKSA